MLLVVICFEEEFIDEVSLFVLGTLIVVVWVAEESWDEVTPLVLGILTLGKSHFELACGMFFILVEVRVEDPFLNLRFLFDFLSVALIKFLKFPPIMLAVGLLVVSVSKDWGLMTSWKP